MKLAVVAKRLEKVLEHALSNQEAVLIPAFSIGRTQELLYELEELIHRRSLNALASPASNQSRSVTARKDNDALLDWSNLPIILDPPLASRFTQTYRALDRYWDAEAKARLTRGRDPQAFRNLLTVDSQ